MLGNVLEISSGFADWEGGLGQQDLPVWDACATVASANEEASDSDQFCLHFSTNRQFPGPEN